MLLEVIIYVISERVIFSLHYLPKRKIIAFFKIKVSSHIINEKRNSNVTKLDQFLRFRDNFMESSKYIVLCYLVVNKHVNNVKM